jgi:hypothetical protein
VDHWWFVVAHHVVRGGTSGGLHAVLEEKNCNKKFWEELICLLSLHSHLFEILKPNLMALNLSELTLTSFNSIELNLTKFTVVNNLIAMVTMEHKQYKPTV